MLKRASLLDLAKSVYLMLHKFSVINSPVKILIKRGERRLACSWSVTRTKITQKAKPSKFLSQNFVVSRAKIHQSRCFTRATLLVAPKMVHFAPKRNARYTSGIPFPTLLSFFLYVRSYADVITKFYNHL